MMESTAITGMAIDNNDAIITLDYVPYSIQVISDIFSRLAKKDVNIDMISQTSPRDNSVSVSFTVPKIELKEAKEVLSYFESKYPEIRVNTKEDITKLSVVGIGMRSQSGVAAQIFALLAKENIEIDMVTTSEIKISYVINPENQQTAIKVIAEEFGL